MLPANALAPSFVPPGPVVDGDAVRRDGVRPADRPLDAAGSAKVSIRRVTVRYGTGVALDDFSLDIAAREVLCVLGPSGSGKTTLLRVLAGLHRPDTGSVWIDGVEVAGLDRFVEPGARHVGMVFQDFALFPHLTVDENVAYGLRGRADADVRAVVARVLGQVGLARHGRRYPHELSGGERQRVALARAVAPAPALLLMDEPFSSLDGELRAQVREETVTLLRLLETTTVLVTHEPQEAARVGDRVALMRAGRLVQCDPPPVLYTQPVSAFAARVFGDVNEVDGVCRDGRVETPLGTFDAPAPVSDGRRLRLCIRPHAITLRQQPSAARGRVLDVAFLGAVERVRLSAEGVAAPIVADVAAGTTAPGDVCFLHVDPAGLMFVADEA